MKLKYFIVILFLSLFTSCKEDVKNQDNNTEVESQDTDKQLLKVSFDLVIKKDDNLHLYYTEDNSINFIEENSIWLPIKGNESQQEVVFKLPQDILPTNIRVDFGHGVNVEQSDVTLKAFRLNYFDKSFEVRDTLIFNYFYPNIDNTIVVEKSSILKRKIKDQPSGPILYPHIPLTEELKKMTQE